MSSEGSPYAASGPAASSTPAPMDVSSEAEMYRPWVGGEHGLVGGRTVSILDPAAAGMHAPHDGAGEDTGWSSFPGSPLLGSSGGDASFDRLLHGDAMQPNSPRAVASGSGEQLNSPLPQPLHSAISNSLGISVPSTSGCPDCMGAKRGAWGETFCRRCGRPYHKAFTGAARGGVGEVGWCDAAIGSFAIWLHRSLRGAPPEI